jgi:ankyrin repeat protein
MSARTLRSDRPATFERSPPESAASWETRIDGEHWEIFDRSFSVESDFAPIYVLTVDGVEAESWDELPRLWVFPAPPDLRTDAERWSDATGPEGSDSAIVALLEANVRPPAVPRGTSDYLARAVAHNRLEGVRALLASGADLEHAGWGGRTPIFSAGYAGTEMFELLVERGARTSARTDVGDDLLLDLVLCHDDAERVRFLLARGFGSTESGAPDPRVLVRAVSRGRVDTTRALLEEGFDARARDDDGVEAIALVPQGELSLVKLLLDHGADPSARGPGGEPLLARASREKSREVVRVLLEKGADPSARRTSDSATVLMVAARAGPAGGLSEVIDSLRSRGLLAVALEVRDGRGLTPLHHAAEGAWKDDAEAVRLLLGEGACADAVSPAGVTPLSCAAGSSGAAVRLLVEAGAPVDVPTDEGITPLMRAVGSDSNEGSVALLLARGAALEARDKSGRTPLMIAAAAGAAGMVAFLLQKAGADPEARDERGHTFRHYEAEHEDQLRRMTD